jgi:hypothetical protein
LVISYDSMNEEDEEEDLLVIRSMNEEDDEDDTQLL